MKMNLFCIAFIMCTMNAAAQSAADLYKKADAANAAKDYKTAALAYAQGVRTEGNSALVFRYRNAAAAFAQAGMADSAFYYLKLIATSSKADKTDAAIIENGSEFSELKKDQRWITTLAAIKKKANNNGYIQQEFIYGRKDGMALTLIQIKPKVKPNGRGIICVISGGFYSNYNGIEVNTTLLEQFLSKGYNVFTVVHSSTPKYTIPDAINDLKRAVRYLRYNALKFGIDPNRIGITGSSSGGHLSLAVATADDNTNSNATDPVDRVSSRVQAASVLYPPTDLLNWGAPGLNMINAKEIVKSKGVYSAIDFRALNEQFRIYEEVADTAARNRIGREICPLYHVTKDDPPVFIIHGDKDATVPLQQSQIIVERFKEAGVKNKFIIIKGADHNVMEMLQEYNMFVQWFDEHLK
jgi:acetyl esterase/lipase